MLDAPAKVRLVGTCSERLFVNIQHLTIGAITDCVSVYLEADANGDLGNLLQALYGLQSQAGASRQVCVGFQQPCAMRAECTVYLSLDRPNGEEAVCIVGHAVPRQQAVHTCHGLSAHHHVQANRQLALVREAAKEVDGAEAGASVVERSNSLG